MVSLGIFFTWPANNAFADEARKVNFVRDVQPIFRKHCYSCHGVEEQQSGLRLDIRKRALDGGDSGAVIKPGSSAKSRLISIVQGNDEDTGIMPPEGDGAPLTQPQISILKQWIDQGAGWPAGADNQQGSKHWSFQKIVRPTPPAGKHAAPNSIDAFINAKLASRNIQPAPAASRNTLIRRLYLDVLGLPPSPEAVQAFINDKRENAYELLVDRVLKSKHYGERWGRHWLDLARYADTDGYEKDRPRPFAWRYRQWVIDALNQDMPFDEFSIRQLAGDLLDKATPHDRIATGFHRNTLHNTEGGVDREEDRVKKTVDRINTTGAIWLGLTVGCAQCHSHKYDPLTQREYFSLYAMLNNIDEADIVVPTAAEQQNLAAQQKQHAEKLARLEAALQHFDETKLSAAQLAWETTARNSSNIWEPVEPLTMSCSNGTKLNLLSDKSILATGKNVPSSVYQIEWLNHANGQQAAPLTAIRLEVLPHTSLPMGGPGRSSGGNFVLSEIAAFSADPLRRRKEERVAFLRHRALLRSKIRFNKLQSRGETEPPEPEDDIHIIDQLLEIEPASPLKFASAKATFSQNKWEVGNAINGVQKNGWAVAPQVGVRQVAIFKFAEPVDADDAQSLNIKLTHQYSGESHNLGRFRLSTTTATGKLPFGETGRIKQLLSVPPDRRSAAQKKSVRDYFLSIYEPRLKLVAEIKAHRLNKPGAKASKARVVAERSSPRQAHVHLRGDFLSPGDAVAPGGPAFLPALKSQKELPDRLDLATWLFDAENPLTARVTVNRIWQRYFGRGIVRTTDDFGLQGERPTHPQLLDWLACQLRDNGWSLKHVHRLILTSATYRQSSTARPELNSIDPLNTLLARQPRRRVEAEIIRDLALGASGLLSRKTGGPSVRPPQPAGYSSLTYAGSARWSTSKGEDAYRRGMYTFFQRTSPYPMLMTFDTPDATVCIAQRAQSNTPLQALTLWNDPVFFEAAQALGRRIVEETPAGKDTDDALTRRRIGHAFMLTLARQPDQVEAATVLRTFKAQLKLSQADTVAAATLCGSQKLPDNVDKATLSAWIVVARVLLNLDEFITRE